MHRQSTKRLVIEQQVARCSLFLFVALFAAGTSTGRREGHLWLQLISLVFCIATLIFGFLVDRALKPRQDADAPEYGRIRKRFTLACTITIEATLLALALLTNSLDIWIIFLLVSAALYFERWRAPHRKKV
jgi:MFS family permease